MSTYTVSLIPAVVDALVAKAKAAVGADVLVLDGPAVTQDTADRIIVGADSDAQTADLGDGGQTWANVGYRQVDESVQVNLTLVAWADTPKAARDRAFGSLLAPLNDAVRADPTLGITAAATMRAQLMRTLRVSVTLDREAGAKVTIGCAVAYESRT